METLKRILAGLVIFLCVLGILVAAFGVVAIWRVNTPVTDNLTQLLTSIDGFLELVETGLVTFNIALSDVVDLVQSLETTVVETGETVKETNLMLLAIDATIGDKLFPLLEKASDTIEMVIDSVIAVNEALEAVNAIPFVTVSTLTADLEAAETGIIEIQNDVEETQKTIQTTKEEAVDTVVTPISTRLSEMDRALQDVSNISTESESQVTASREGIADVIQKLPGWINLASVTMTLLMAWLIFAQGSLLLLSYVYIRTGEFKITLGDGKADDEIEEDFKGEDEVSDA